MKWIKLFEEYTGIFKTKSKGIDMVLKLDIQEVSGITNIKLILDDRPYDDLSVIIPDSFTLNKGEFYINPNIDKNIIYYLVNQNFISKLDKSGIVGDKVSNVYTLNI